MSQDRTSEFLSLARSLPDPGLTSSYNSHSGGTSGRYGSAPASAPPSSVVSSNDELRQFHKTAADISRDIAATSAMLSELANLVRQKSLFADDTQHINSLVMRIKSNVEDLNGRLDDAGAVIARQKRKLGKNSQAGQEASNLVGQLKEEFVEATAGFKKVLEQRTDTMKETTDLKKQVYGAGESGAGDHDPVPIVSLENKPPVYSAVTPMGRQSFGAYPTLDLTSGMSAGEPTSSGSQLPRPHGAMGVGGSAEYGNSLRLRHSNSEPMQTYSGSYSSYHRNAAPLTPLDIQRMESESGQQQLMQLIPDQDYLQERANAMSQVETQIVELGTIFNKLAVMVSEHREMVTRVEDNVDEANTNMTLSLNTLTDTLHNLQTNRALFLKILAVLVIFIVFFVIVLA